MPGAMEATPAVFPAPVFEGSEKRIELCFNLARCSVAGGLRALAREQLDAVCTAAHCCIVSCRANEHFDAYVLSESSLFVYQHKVVLKTCGTTRLLDAVPVILELAAELDAQPAKCRYSRASFMFPEQQPAPHNSFEGETAFLQRYFGDLPGGSAAYVVGDALNGLQWHVYVADAACSHFNKPCYTLEVCMTGLCSAKARQFFRDHNEVEAATVTAESGIGGLVPGAAIDDYVFEPCGYSMNGIEGEGFLTVHITPEDGFSYASVELSGFAPDAIGGAQAIVSKVSEIFAPRNVSVSLTVDAPVADYSWAETFALPEGYAAACSTLQDLRGGGYVAFVTAHPCKASPPWQPGSPRSVLKKLPSFSTLGGSSSATLAALESNPGGGGHATHHGPGSGPPRARPRAGSSGTDSDTDVNSCDSSLASSLVLMPSDAPDAQAPDADAIIAGLPPPAAGSNAAVKRFGGLDLQLCEPSGTGASLGAPPSDADLSDVYALLGAVPLRDNSAATLHEHASRLVAAHGLEDSFYVFDLATVRRLYEAWTAAMPRVVPFYAVKCNTDKGLLSVLARLGAGFDCASDAEVDAVLGLGVPAGRIVYANACKRPRDIRHAAARGINLTTFDAECELAKIARWHPCSEALLRIRADDPGARCQLGNKYGAEPEEWLPLLRAAAHHNVRVVGVSFHVGSGATNPDAFSQAIAAARQAFDLGSSLGFDMQLLDIGGGFAGGRVDAAGRVDLGGVPSAVNSSLTRHFPPETGVRVIAEPGRYFAEAMATYATMVFGTRARPVDMGNGNGGGSPSGGGSDGQGGHGGGSSASSDDGMMSGMSGTAMEYWVTDGLYGAMNSVLYDHAELSCAVLCRGSGDESQQQHGGGAGGQQGGSVAGEPLLHSSTVFGPTCDGLDTVLRGVALPELQVGDWLLWHRMGAYTSVGASNFNGIDATAARVFYVATGAAASW